jgi:hypothetical protein
VVLIIIGHMIGKTFEVEKERREIDCFSRNVRHDFSIPNNFFLKNFFHFCFLEMLEILEMLEKNSSNIEKKIHVYGPKVQKSVTYVT